MHSFKRELTLVQPGVYEWSIDKFSNVSMHSFACMPDVSWFICME